MVTWLAALISATAAFVIAVGLTPLLAGWARRRNLLDVPNARSSHVVATPRTGGAAFVPALLVGLGLFQLFGERLAIEAFVMVSAASGLALVGLVDDVRPLPAGVRLVVQVGIAGALVSALGPLPMVLSGWPAAALTIVWLVAFTNAYNFMDGIDGIAGAQAAVVGAGWAVLGVTSGSRELVVLGSLAVAVTAGFLVHNWLPARVFMGDAGSGFLGFYFGALPFVAASKEPHVTTWAVLLMWPFLFDTAFTLLRRLRRRENIFSAHRSHLYQRMVISGASHARVSLMYATLTGLGLAGSLAVAVNARVGGAVSALAVGVAALALWWHVVSREARD